MTVTRKYSVVECVNGVVVSDHLTLAAAESRRNELQAVSLREGLRLTQCRYGIL